MNEFRTLVSCKGRVFGYHLDMIYPLEQKSTKRRLKIVIFLLSTSPIHFAVSHFERHIFPCGIYFSIRNTEAGDKNQISLLSGIMKFNDKANGGIDNLNKSKKQALQAVLIILQRQRATINKTLSTGYSPHNSRKDSPPNLFQRSLHHPSLHRHRLLRTPNDKKICSRADFWRTKTS